MVDSRYDEPAKLTLPIPHIFIIFYHIFKIVIFYCRMMLNIHFISLISKHQATPVIQKTKTCSYRSNLLSFSEEWQFFIHIQGNDVNFQFFTCELYVNSEHVRKSWCEYTYSFKISDFNFQGRYLHEIIFQWLVEQKSYHMLECFLLSEKINF